jgi:hypothetical protein
MTGNDVFNVDEVLGHRFKFHELCSPSWGRERRELHPRVDMMSKLIRRDIEKRMGEAWGKMTGERQTSTATENFLFPALPFTCIVNWKATCSNDSDSASGSEQSGTEDCTGNPVSLYR